MFGENGLCFGFSNTYYVDSLDKFRKAVIENVADSIDNLRTENFLEENKK